METMTVADFKANFSEVLKKVQKGEEIAISFGKRKEIVARLVPVFCQRNEKRKIGIFEGKGKVDFKDDFSINEEDLL